MITWCRFGQRALLRRLSALLLDVGHGLGYDSQPLAVHDPPVTVGDQASTLVASSHAENGPGTGAQMMLDYLITCRQHR
jgi:hypothetical protein